jgi:hypothetical protein
LGEHPWDWCRFKKRDTASGRFFTPVDGCAKCHHRVDLHTDDGCQHVYGDWRCNCRALLAAHKSTKVDQP